MKSNVDETIRLVCLLLEEQISAADFQRLNELLQRDEESRRIYIQSIHMHDQLPELIFRNVALGAPASLFPPTRTNALAGPVGLAMVSLVLLAVVGLFVGWGFWGRRMQPADVALLEPLESIDPNVAVVTAAIDVVWGSSEALRQGDGAAPGTLEIESGILRLEFYCGAAVLLEGPARLELKSSTCAVLSAGRLRAHVPPEASGFTILSPGLRLVDQGTEFGVIASESGETQVHVFDGLVDIYPNSDPPPGGTSQQTSTPRKAQRLSTGDGVLLDSDGMQQQIAANANDFVSFRKANELVSQSIGQRQRTWLQWKKSFTNDRRVYGWFDFDRQSTSIRRLRGLVPTNAPLTGTPLTGTPLTRTPLTRTPLTGALVGCRAAAGRWPDETSLEFKHPGDRVRLSLPEEFESMTLMVWTRIDALDHRFNGLLMSDDRDIGRPHWQINRRGELVLGVRNTKGLHNYKTDVVIDEFMLGRWIHLTTVYDSNQGVVKHFVNGSLVGNEKILDSGPLVFGDTEIGNWRNALGKTRTPIRSLNGCIDELIIFRAALPDDEISRIHELGRP